MKIVWNWIEIVLNWKWSKLKNLVIHLANLTNVHVLDAATEIPID